MTNVFIKYTICVVLGLISFLVLRYIFGVEENYIYPLSFAITAFTLGLYNEIINVSLKKIHATKLIEIENEHKAEKKSIHSNYALVTVNNIKNMIENNNEKSIPSQIDLLEDFLKSCQRCCKDVRLNNDFKRYRTGLIAFKSSYEINALGGKIRISTPKFVNFLNDLVEFFKQIKE